MPVVWLFSSQRPVSYLSSSSPEDLLSLLPLSFLQSSGKRGKQGVLGSWSQCQHWQSQSVRRSSPAHSPSSLPPFLPCSLSFSIPPSLFCLLSFVHSEFNCVKPRLREPILRATRVLGLRLSQGWTRQLYRSSSEHGDGSPGRTRPGRWRRQARVAPPWSLLRVVPARRIRL